jgi:hypothetical protein
MHRTYSMRQSRAPTASQIQNPPPPSSSTKAGRFFGKSNIGELFLPLSHCLLLTTCRPLFPQRCRWRFRTRSRQEAVAAGEDGEERHALHGARRQRENGGRSKLIYCHKIDRLPMG